MHLAHHIADALFRAFQVSIHAVDEGAQCDSAPDEEWRKEGVVIVYSVLAIAAGYLRKVFSVAAIGQTSAAKEIALKDFPFGWIGFDLKFLRQVGIALRRWVRFQYGLEGFSSCLVTGAALKI